MTKRVCCSVLLAVVACIVTTIVTIPISKYPELLKPIVGCFAFIMFLAGFNAYGYGERREGNCRKVSLATGIILFAMILLTWIVIAHYYREFAIIALYTSAMATVVSAVSYKLGESSYNERSLR